jgi:regulator of ribonuclease activity A
MLRIGHASAASVATAVALTASQRFLNTNDLCDKYFKEPAGSRPKFQVLDPALRLQHFGGRRAFHGQAATVKCFEDNTCVKKLAATPGNGRVMVVDGGASLRRALLGDMIAKQAMESGWAGFLIHGAVRDVDELVQLPKLGVLALGSVPIKTCREGLGATDVSLAFGGALIEPGFWVYCDETGVVVSSDKLSL